MAAAAATRPKPAGRAERNARAIQRSRAQGRTAAARPAPASPRRRSGPAPARAPRPAQPVSVARIAHGGAAALLDRVLRGRAWVALVAVLLTGIVFLNVSVLELNRGIARTDAQSGALERTNSALRSRLAVLDSAERIQRLASARGFVLPQPGDITYVRPGAATARLAAERIRPPSSTLASGSTATSSSSTTAAAPTATAAPATSAAVPAATPATPTTTSSPAAAALTAHP